MYERLPSQGGQQQNGNNIHIFLDASPAALDRHHKMNEINAALTTAWIRYHWGFPFSILEAQDILNKLNLTDAEALPRPPSTSCASTIWNIPFHLRDF